MKQAKKIFSCTVFFVMILLFSINVFAANWTVCGDADIKNGECILTQKYKTKMCGRIIKDIPIDTRSDFSISFEYWVGDYSNQKREGFQVIFTDEEIGTSGSDYFDMGYDHILEPVGLFRAVEFNSYARHIGFTEWKPGYGYSPRLKSSKDMEICDNTWHYVTLEYENGKMNVYKDGALFTSTKDFSLKGITFVAFTGSNSYYGTQTIKIRNIRTWAEEPALLTLNANGGTISPTKAWALRYSNYTLPTPAKYGNTFLGWYTANKGGKKVTNTNYNFAAKQTLYARWKDNTVKVTFNANGGTVGTKTKALLPKSKIGTLPTPTRKNYTFKGWYTKKKGGKKITTGYVIKKKTTVYAQWIRNSTKVTIKLYKNGGSCKKSSIKVTYGGKVTGLPTASRKGYTFLGWYTKKSGGTKVTAATKTTSIVSSKKLYAHWRKKSSSGSSSSSSSGSSGNRNCAVCHGSRRCNKCGGDGYIYNYVTGRDNRNCTRCNTSGRCIYCR